MTAVTEHPNLVAMLTAEIAAYGDQIHRCEDMLGDVPGETLEQKLTHYIGSYMALQVENDRLRKEPVAAALLSACKDAAKWLSGWASAEPYLSALEAAIARAEPLSDTHQPEES